MNEIDNLKEKIKALEAELESRPKKKSRYDIGGEYDQEQEIKRLKEEQSKKYYQKGLWFLK